MDREFYQKLLNTAESAGIKTLSDDHCCKLLAWLYGYGGSNEAVTLGVKLNENIKLAQRRLNVYGGETVNAELFPELKTRILEVEKAIAGKSEHPKWTYEICDYYGLSHGMIS